MSFPRFELQGAIRDARCYSRSEKAVLNAIVSRANNAGACWPPYEVLASDTGYSRAAVAAALASLQTRTDGPLRLTVQHQGKRDGSGGRGSNVYRVELNPVAGLKPVESIPETQRAVESKEKTQPAPAVEELSPEIDGLSPKMQAVESSQWTGSSPTSSPISPPEGGAHVHHEHVTGATSQTPKAKRRPNKKPAIALPDDWQPTESHRAFAAKHGIALELEATKFRGHAEAHARLCVVWNGAFTQWLGTQAGWNKADPRRGPRRLPEPQRGVVDESAAANWGKSADSPFAMASGDRD